jgi:hypothetical protein
MMRNHRLYRITVTQDVLSRPTDSLGETILEGAPSRSSETRDYHILAPNEEIARAWFDGQRHSWRSENPKWRREWSIDKIQAIKLDAVIIEQTY